MNLTVFNKMFTIIMVLVISIYVNFRHNKSVECSVDFLHGCCCYIFFGLVNFLIETPPVLGGIIFVSDGISRYYFQDGK